MRITSGKYKNQPILSPNLSTTHPMGDRERLALFNALTSILLVSDKSFENLSVLDVFAGTGALGLEAMSRGAKSIVFVEKNKDCIEIIKANLKKFTGKPDNKDIEILKKDAKSLNLDKNFGLILADPPYNDFDLNSINNLENLLKDSGILVLSLEKSIENPKLESLKLLKTTIHARCKLLFYQKKP